MGCNNYGEIILCVSQNYFVHKCIYEGKGYYTVVVVCAIWICFCGSTWTPIMGNDGQRRTGSEIKWKPRYMRSEIYQDIRDISRIMIWDPRYGWTELGH